MKLKQSRDLSVFIYNIVLVAVILCWDCIDMAVPNCLDAYDWAGLVLTPEYSDFNLFGLPTPTNHDTCPYGHCQVLERSFAQTRILQPTTNGP